MKLKKIRNALLVVLTLALVSATTVAITWAVKTKVALIGQIVKGCQACRMIFFLLEDEKSILFGFLSLVPPWHKPFSAPAVPVLWVLGSIPNKQKGTGIYRCPACEVVNR